MARYAAFLRAINVGDRKATGAQLRAAADREGFEEVASFRNSGNLVVSTGGPKVGTVKKRLERGLRKELGFEVAVFARDARQLKAISGHAPFTTAEVKRSKGKLQVLLLGRKPTAVARKKALQLRTDADLLALRGTELYWLPSAGTQDSGLDQKALAEILGESTTRTMGTIEQMAAKYFSG